MQSKGLTWDSGDKITAYAAEAYCAAGVGVTQDFYVDDISFYRNSTQQEDSVVKLIKGQDNNLTLMIKDALLQVPNSKLTTDSWNHIMFTLSGSAASLYINDIKEISNQPVTYNFPASVTPILGSNQVASSRFDGVLDEVILYNSALTDAEIQNLANVSAPATPTNSSPANGQAGVTLTLALTALSYSEPDGDGHQASRWQVREVDGVYGDVNSYDSNTVGDLTSHSVNLNAATDYSWRVQYQDDRGAWSNWSSETIFSTQ
jgi:hypothetical protein